MWYLPRVGRTSGAEKFRSSAKKDFFSSIGAKQTLGKTPTFAKWHERREAW